MKPDELDLSKHTRPTTVARHLDDAEALKKWAEKAKERKS